MVCVPPMTIHLEDNEYRFIKEKAFENVFVVVPSSKLSPNCVDNVSVEFEKVPY
jgi:hypothetical protein